VVWFPIAVSLRFIGYTVRLVGAHLRVNSTIDCLQPLFWFFTHFVVRLHTTTHLLRLQILIWIYLPLVTLYIHPHHLDVTYVVVTCCGFPTFGLRTVWLRFVVPVVALLLLFIVVLPQTQLPRILHIAPHTLPHRSPHTGRFVWTRFLFQLVTFVDYIFSSLSSCLCSVGYSAFVPDWVLGSVILILFGWSCCF